MLRSIIQKIFGPIIRREILKIMKDLIQPIIDLVKAVIVHKEGTKFLVTGIGIGSIIYLHINGISSLGVDIVIAAIIAIYYAADIYSKNKKNGDAPPEDGK